MRTFGTKIQRSRSQVYEGMKGRNEGMKALVGYTGFVGSNIYAKGDLDAVYNSKNISEAYGTCPDLLIYAGMRAEKFLANNDPQADLQLVLEAEQNIEKIAPKKLVLISTIDIFKDPNGKDETSAVDLSGLHAYGADRYVLEQWVRENYPDALIIRLPGLYGINIKKNFIYDYINVIPSMLKADKFTELSAQAPVLAGHYQIQSNGFYKCGALSETEKTEMKAVFKDLGFTALNFTDSRNVYQFYPLSRLWSDIGIALEHGLKLWHPATEPVSAAEVYHALTGETFSNEVAASPVYYDYRTCHAELFGGRDGYLMSKAEVLEDIKQFVKEQLK